MVVKGEWKFGTEIACNVECEYGNVLGKLSCRKLEVGHPWGCRLLDGSPRSAEHGFAAWHTQSSF